MTTIDAPPAKLTREDLLRLPDSNLTELVDGRLVEKKPASALSSETENLIGGRLALFAIADGVARVYSATLGYQCFKDDPHKIRKPNCTVIRLERLRSLPDPNPGFMPIVPDLAVEVISTNDTWDEVDEKVQEYLDAGFPLIWIADPKLRQILIYSSQGEPRLASGDQEIRCESALPGFVCKVSELFPPRA